MSPADVAELVLLLTAAFPDYRLNDATAQTYQSFLLDLELEDAMAVIVNHVATRKWFPKISEIREAALERKLGIDSTETVFALLQGDLSKSGPLSDMAREALKLTGDDWEMRHTNNPSAWRAQFRKNYEALREAVFDEKRKEATQELLAQFATKQLEDDNDRPAQLTRGHSPPGYFCHHCHKSHPRDSRCPRQ